MKDKVLRVVKTFIQSFLGVLIPQVTALKVFDLDLTSFKTWLVPLICSAVAAGITAAWNALKGTFAFGSLPDWASRALKTFIETFFGVLIPEAVAILNDVLSYDWTSWKTWVLPIVAGAIASAISAAWNAIAPTTPSIDENQTDDVDQSPLE